MWSEATSTPFNKDHLPQVSPVDSEVVRSHMHPFNKDHVPQVSPVDSEVVRSHIHPFNKDHVPQVSPVDSEVVRSSSGQGLFRCVGFLTMT